MAYVPNLVPQHSRVNIDFSKRNSPNGSTPKPKSVLYYLSSGVGLTLMLLGFLNLFTKPFYGLSVYIIGAVLFPKFHETIEETLQFKFNLKIKSCFVVVLIIIASIFLSNYTKEEERLFAIEKAKKEQLALEEKNRIDSLNYYLNEASSNSKSQNYLASISAYNSAFKFNKDTTGNLFLERGTCFFMLNKYKEAIEDFTSANAYNETKSEALYHRAECLLKLNKIPDAVSDLKAAIDLGNSKAEKLHNKINPILRRIIGQHNVCCDGSISYSSGRGTCSHHGGICNTEYDYQEYRKY